MQGFWVSENRGWGIPLRGFCSISGVRGVPLFWELPIYDDGEPTYSLRPSCSAAGSLQPGGFWVRV